VEDDPRAYNYRYVMGERQAEQSIDDDGSAICSQMETDDYTPNLNIRGKLFQRLNRFNMKVKNNNYDHREKRTAYVSSMKQLHTDLKTRRKSGPAVDPYYKGNNRT